jgi:GT2 family glycosyltransferase
MGKLRLSVVIITWNERATLERCLHSLMPTLSSEYDEVIVIDNGSVDATDTMIAAHFPRVRYERLEKNIGVGPARNIGIRKARSEFVMILDNDTEIVTPGFPRLIEDTFAGHPDLGLLAFRLLNEDGSTQRNVRRGLTVLQPFVGRLSFLRKIPAFRRQYESHYMLDIDLNKVDGLLDVDYALGAHQVFKRSLVGKIGGYDENFFFGPEDCDFCLRVWDSGLRVAYTNQASIRHLYRRRTRRIFSKLTLSHIVSHYYLFWKRRAWFKVSRAR